MLFQDTLSLDDMVGYYLPVSVVDDACCIAVIEEYCNYSSVMVNIVLYHLPINSYNLVVDILHCRSKLIIKFDHTTI